MRFLILSLHSETDGCQQGFHAALVQALGLAGKTLRSSVTADQRVGMAASHASTYLPLACSDMTLIN